MNFIDMLGAAERQNASMLCVGLDPEPARFPHAWRGDAQRIYDFCAAIVDATADLVVAFKPQIAYFAAHRAEEQLERLMAHMRVRAPQVPIILDAKRGDIGSTMDGYAEGWLTNGKTLEVDALTVNGYLGIGALASTADLATANGNGLLDLTDNLERLRSQLRDIELQAETQIGTRMEAS